MLLESKTNKLQATNDVLLNIENSLTAQEIESIQIVYNMFINMNISKSGAMTLVKILCTDTTITAEMRHNLINLYHRYTRLIELHKANADFNQDIIGTNLKEVQLQLQLYLMKLMPINSQCVERDIAELQFELDKQLRKRDMLKMSQTMISGMYMEPANENIPGRLALEPKLSDSRHTNVKSKTIAKAEAV